MKQKGKKCWLCLAVCLMLTMAGIAGCIGKGEKTDTNKQGGQEEEISNGFGVTQVEDLLPKKLITIGFVQAGHESDWRIAATQCCMETFSEENGYRLYFIDADNDHRAQVDAVRSFIKDKVDYILIDPVVETGWTAALKEAYHAKIPVFVLDRRIDCDARYYQAWFGSDFVREGECAGSWLQNYLEMHGLGKQLVKIVAINGTVGSTAQLGRTEGFAKYLKQNENWELLAQDSGGFTEKGGRQVMQKYLDTYTEIDVVVCQNDSQAYGAMSVLDEAGITYGKDGDILLLSFDATRGGLEAVEQGKINANFECNPFAPAYAAEMIQTLESGGNIIKKDNYLDEDCFTCEEEPAYIVTSAGVTRMARVTADLIKDRDY